MRVLILDDDEDRHTEFRKRYRIANRTHVYTADQAIDTLLSSDPFDIVQLDHDLGGETYCPSDGQSGWVVAKAIAEMAGAKRQKRVIVHSYNARGAVEMLRCLVEKGLSVEYRPFGVWEDQPETNAATA